MRSKTSCGPSGFEVSRKTGSKVGLLSKPAGELASLAVSSLASVLMLGFGSMAGAQNSASAPVPRHEATAVAVPSAETSKDSVVDSAQSPGAMGGPREPPAFGSPSGSGSVLSSFMEPFEYDPQGRKDPFKMPMMEKPLPPGVLHGPLLPLQKFRLDELALTGIIWDVTRPRAMVKDPLGKIHVVGPYTKVGNQNGYIAVIREGEIVVIETYEEDGKLLSAPRIVKLTGGAKAAPGH